MQTNRQQSSKVRTPGSESKNTRSRGGSSSSQNNSTSSTKSNNRSASSSSSNKLKDSTDYGDDDYEVDDDFEDAQSENGSDGGFDIADDGLVSQSGSFNDESSEFLGRSRTTLRNSMGLGV